MSDEGTRAVSGKEFSLVGGIIYRIVSYIMVLTEAREWIDVSVMCKGQTMHEFYPPVDNRKFHLGTFDLSTETNGKHCSLMFESSLEIFRGIRA